MKINRKSNEKYKELWYRLSSHISFNDSISFIRKKFKIPKSGFKNPKKLKKWVVSEKNNLDKDWENEIYNLLFKIIPIDTENNLLAEEGDDMYDITQTYAIEGLIAVKEHLSDATFYFGCSIMDSAIFFGKKSSSIWKDRLRKRVLISLKPYVSKDDILDFLNKKWSEINRLLIKNGKNDFKRIRKSTYKNRDHEISRLYKLSRKKLNLGKRGTGNKIDRIISIMSEKGYFGLTAERVWEIIRRQRKLEKGEI